MCEVEAHDDHFSGVDWAKILGYFLDQINEIVDSSFALRSPGESDLVPVNGGADRFDDEVIYFSCDL